jgi:hypothetical protein
VDVIAGYHVDMKMAVFQMVDGSASVVLESTGEGEKAEEY